jgi:hypothetical protein
MPIARAFIWLPLPWEGLRVPTHPKGNPCRVLSTLGSSLSRNQLRHLFTTDCEDSKLVGSESRWLQMKGLGRPESSMKAWETFPNSIQTTRDH